MWSTNEKTNKKQLIVKFNGIDKTGYITLHQNWVLDSVDYWYYDYLNNEQLAKVTYNDLAKSFNVEYDRLITNDSDNYPTNTININFVRVKYMSINVYTGHGSKWADGTTEMKQIKVFILMTNSLRIRIYNDTGSLNDNAYPRDANGLPVNTSKYVSIKYFMRSWKIC